MVFFFEIINLVAITYNLQEASSPAQQGSPISVTQHASNGLDEPISDSNVSTTNHTLAAVEAGEEWVDEEEELEVSKILSHLDLNLFFLS